MLTQLRSPAMWEAWERSYVPPCSVELHWWFFACSHWHQWLSLSPSLALPLPPQFGLCESSHMLCCTWSTGEGRGGGEEEEEEKEGEKTKRERKTGIRGCEVDARQTYTTQASKPFWISNTKQGKLRGSIWKHKTYCILHCTQSDLQYLETEREGVNRKYWMLPTRGTHVLIPNVAIREESSCHLVLSQFSHFVPST